MVLDSARFARFEFTSDNVRCSPSSEATAAPLPENQIEAPVHSLPKRVGCLGGRSLSKRHTIFWFRPAGTQLRPRSTVRGSGWHARHCRSGRSIDHSLGQRSFRRGDATQRLRRLTALRRLNHSAPTTERDYSSARGQPPPADACTIRTMPEADRRGGHIVQHDAGNDDGERGAAAGLLRSLQMRIVRPLQLRWVGSLKFLSRGRSPERSPVLRKHSIKAGDAMT